LSYFVKKYKRQFSLINFTFYLSNETSIIDEKQFERKNRMQVYKFVNKRFKILILIALNNILLYVMIKMIYFTSSGKNFIFLKNENEELFRMNLKKIERPIIFIGGYGRSGTTLMRALIGTHPNVSCVPESKIIPDLLEFIENKRYSIGFIDDLAHAGITENMLDMATANFIYTLTELQNSNTEFQCTKDPNNVKHMVYLKKIFPNAKIVYMVRDGRDVAVSYMKQYNESLNYKNMKIHTFSWSIFNKIVGDQCNALGKSSCLMVKYEELVLELEKTMKKVVDFLNLTWTDNFLKHERFIGDKVKVSDTEWSTDQIKKPIYKNSMRNWIHVKDYNETDLKSYAHVLESFGYQV